MNHSPHHGKKALIQHWRCLLAGRVATKCRDPASSHILMRRQICRPVAQEALISALCGQELRPWFQATLVPQAAVPKPHCRVRPGRRAHLCQRSPGSELTASPGLPATRELSRARLSRAHLTWPLSTFSAVHPGGFLQQDPLLKKSKPSPSTKSL